MSRGRAAARNLARMRASLYSTAGCPRPAAAQAGARRTRGRGEVPHAAPTPTKPRTCTHRWPGFRYETWEAVGVSRGRVGARDRTLIDVRRLVGGGDRSSTMGWCRWRNPQIALRRTMYHSTRGVLNESTTFMLVDLLRRGRADAGGPCRPDAFGVCRRVSAPIRRILRGNLRDQRSEVRRRAVPLGQLLCASRMR